MSRLDLHILGPDYLEIGVSCFTQVITEDKVQEIAGESGVCDSKEKKKRQATLRKEKRDAQSAVCFSASYLRKSSAAVLVFNLSTQSASAGSARSAQPISGLTTSSTSAKSAEFAGPVSGLFALSAFAGSAVPISNTSAPSASAWYAVLMLGLSALFASAPSASSMNAVLELDSSISTTSVVGLFAFFVLVVIPTLERKKLIELNQREKKATSKELTPAFILFATV